MKSCIFFKGNVFPLSGSDIVDESLFSISRLSSNPTPEKAAKSV